MNFGLRLLLGVTTRVPKSSRAHFLSCRSFVWHAACASQPAVHNTSSEQVHVVGLVWPLSLVEITICLVLVQTTQSVKIAKKKKTHGAFVVESCVPE